MRLFETEKIILPLNDGVFEYYPNFLSELQANNFLTTLVNETPWQHDEITIFGKKILQPRLTAFYGNENTTYSYSNTTMLANRWNPDLITLKNKIEELTQLQFNSALLNLYRNEMDSNGWHADNERELGSNPIIASLSLGEERIFQIKHNTKNEKIKLNLTNGSLLLMKEGSQIHYKHQLPKTKTPKKTRLNITFRTIY